MTDRYGLGVKRGSVVGVLFANDAVGEVREESVALHHEKGGVISASVETLAGGKLGAREQPRTVVA
jgi:hypothetical protein